VIKKLQAINIWGIVALLCATPLIAALAPRAFAWWVPLLGLFALPLGDKDKTPMWIMASVPMWIGTWSLMSIMWAAYPDLQLEKAIARLPMLYGLSIAVLGLGNLREDVWEKAMSPMFWVYTVSIFAAWLEYSFDFPLYRLFNKNVADLNVAQFVMNRGLTGMAMLVIPMTWIGWHKGHKKLALFLVIFLTAGMAITEASAAFLSILVAEVIFVLAWFWPNVTRYLMMISGAVKIMIMPVLALFMFTHMPPWDALNSPSTGGRLEIWYGVSKLIQNHPIMGYGYEATRFLPLPIKQAYFNLPIVMHPHNAALQFWIEFGVLGAIACAIGWINWAQKSRSAPALALMAMTGTVGFLSYGLWQGAWLGLAIFALLYWRAAATSFGNKIQ